MEILKIIIIVFTATLLAAIPFGLVNLTILHVTTEKGKAYAMKIAHGASVIEVIYVVLAFFLGKSINILLKENSFIQIIVVAVPLITGIFFWFKINRNKKGNSIIRNGFLKGIVFNLLSIQVLLFWLLAMTVIISRWLPDLSPEILLIIISTAWFGKMLVLYIYSSTSKFIMYRFTFFSENINRIIGTILIITAIIQYLKYQ